MPQDHGPPRQAPITRKFEDPVCAGLDSATHRQEADLLAAGVRQDDLYIDLGVSGARATRPQFDRALNILIEGDTLVITTLDRLGHSTQNMLALAGELRTPGAGLRVLNLGGGDVDTATPIGLDAVHEHGCACADGT